MKQTNLSGCFRFRVPRSEFRVGFTLIELLVGIVITALMTVLAAQTAAQPAYVLESDFKPVFQTNPTNTTPDYDAFPNAAAMQADGKIVVAGRFTFVNGDARNGLARLNGNGSHDPAFNPAYGGEILALHVAVQPDQKLLVGGTGSGSTLFRLNQDGSRDSTFVSNSFEPVRKAFVLPDSRILIDHFGDIRRLNSDGSLDPTFNSNDVGEILAIQSDGKILLLGRLPAPVNEALVRLNTDGSRDEDFKMVRIADIGMIPMSAVVQSNGKIVLAGSDGTGGLTNGVIRLEPNGDLDPTFNLRIDWQVYRTMLVAQRTDARLFLTATRWDGTLDMVILSPDGSVDFSTSFSIPLTRFGASVLGFQPDGGVVIQIDYRWDGGGGFDFIRFNPTPVWRSPSFDANGRFAGIIGCLPNWRYRVEASADLRQWDIIANGTSTSEWVPFSDATAGQTGRRFYRAVKE